MTNEKQKRRKGDGSDLVTVGHRSGIEVDIHRSTIDGKMVVQINTESFPELDHRGALSILRIYVNEGRVYECYVSGHEEYGDVE